MFEDLDFLAKDSEPFKKLVSAVGARLFDVADRAFFVERACLVHDDVMTLLLQTCTEITTRIKLKQDTKTVDKDVGGLWTEEALPKKLMN